MAQSASPAAAPASAGLLTRGLSALGRALSFLAENNPRYQQLRAVQMMSEAELAARGVTRADMVRRIFHDRSYL
ncbi:DUF1127 domain-containing protein [Roseivivax sp. CAU 1761]